MCPANHRVIMTTPLPSTPEYVCPMHALIVRDAPGSCPICGRPSSDRRGSASDNLSTECACISRYYQESRQ